MNDWMVMTPGDSVAVALRELPAGMEVCGGVTVRVRIPAGHKVALAEHAHGTPVIKYANPIGTASAHIQPGDWVHTHNLRTGLDGKRAYTWSPQVADGIRREDGPCFWGYVRPDGQIGIRNELWILPTVGCVSRTAALIAEAARARYRDCFTEIVAFTHSYGCSQSGDDAVMTRDLLAALARNPNAACVLMLGLGCEVNRLEELMPLLEGDPRVVGFETQKVGDEIAHAMELLAPWAERAREQTRVEVPISKLRVGLKCGGSDGYSGLTANPLLGAVCDRLAAWGGSCAMTEVPEMFGAEHLLMNRAANRVVFDRLVAMIDGFKEYFIRHGQPIYDNPSPGNRDGGITTLEEKSLGCTQKGGSAPVVDVLDYAQAVTLPGLSLVWGPGSDMVACTALAAAGCQIILFTTGRGTPYGGPVPTLKIATNSGLARGKPGWIDYDAGALLGDVSMEEARDGLLAEILKAASGEPTRCEAGGYRELAIFKDGVIQ